MQIDDRLYSDIYEVLSARVRAQEFKLKESRTLLYRMAEAARKPAAAAEGAQEGSDGH